MRIIDRFEGEDAFVEDERGAMRKVPRRDLPADAREGDVLTDALAIDPVATRERRERIARVKRKLLG